MAQRRMLSRRVSASKKMAMISYRDEAVWARGLPQTDDKGFLPTPDPEELRGLLFPLGKNGRRFPINMMQDALQNLIDVELLIWCSCPYRKCLKYTNFELFQTLKNDRSLHLYGKEIIGDLCDPNVCIPAEFHLESKPGIQCPPSPYTYTSSPNTDKTEQQRGEDSLEPIYQAMPKKVGKKAALSAIRATLKRCKDATEDDLRLAASNYAALVAREKREAQFIMHPATFFGPKEHWRDYLKTVIEEPTCGSCTNGPNEKSSYCPVAMKDRKPTDKPCGEYQEVA